MRRISVSRPERVTQWARMRNSGYLRVTRRRLSRFRSFRRRVLNENLLRTCDSSLKSATAGTRGWSCFCDAATRPHYPPTEGGVLARSSFFGAGKSFKIYVARLEKPCLLLGVDTSWRPKAVATAGYSLAEGGGRTFTPRSVTSRAQLCELVTSLSLQDELALIASIGWSSL